MNTGSLQQRGRAPGTLNVVEPISTHRFLIVRNKTEWIQASNWIIYGNAGRKRVWVEGRIELTSNMRRGG